MVLSAASTSRQVALVPEIWIWRTVFNPCVVSCVFGDEPGWV